MGNSHYNNVQKYELRAQPGNNATYFADVTAQCDKTHQDVHHQPSLNTSHLKLPQFRQFSMVDSEIAHTRFSLDQLSSFVPPESTALFQ